MHDSNSRDPNEWVLRYLLAGMSYPASDRHSQPALSQSYLVTPSLYYLYILIFCIVDDLASEALMTEKEQQFQGYLIPRHSKHHTREHTFHMQTN